MRELSLELPCGEGLSAEAFEPLSRWAELSPVLCDLQLTIEGQISRQTLEFLSSLSRCSGLRHLEIAMQQSAIEPAGVVALRAFQDLPLLEELSLSFSWSPIYDEGAAHVLELCRSVMPRLRHIYLGLAGCGLTDAIVAPLEDVLSGASPLLMAVRVILKGNDFTTEAKASLDGLKQRLCLDLSW